MYVLRCADSSLYAGITTDLQRRLMEHNSTKKGAKYTRSRRPVTLLVSASYSNRSLASKAEYYFKKQKKSTKELLVSDPEEFLKMSESFER